MKVISKNIVTTLLGRVCLGILCISILTLPGCAGLGGFGGVGVVENKTVQMPGRNSYHYSFRLSREGDVLIEFNTPSNANIDAYLLTDEQYSRNQSDNNLAALHGRSSGTFARRLGPGMYFFVVNNINSNTIPLYYKITVLEK